MNPDQRTPPSESWRDDYNRPRRTMRDSSFTPEPSPLSDYHRTTNQRTTQTGTYGVGISPSPSPPGETETMTPGQNHPTRDPVAYQTTGRYGINPWPLSSSLSTYCPHTDAASRLRRAPWSGLANVLEDRTRSLSPPPVELSVYHPLQMMTQLRHLTPTPSLTGTFLSRFESAPTSPKISRPPTPRPIPTRINEPHESSFSSTPEERRTHSMLTVPTLSGQNSARLIERSWGSPEQRHGSSDNETSKTGSPTVSLGRENPWPSILPLIEGSRSALLMPLPYSSDSSSMPIERYGTPPQVADYSIYDPEPLMNKAPWSTPSPVLYGKKDHGAPEPPHRFPHGYAPQPLPDEPP